MQKAVVNKNIIFFDGVCHLCNRYIDFLVKINTGKNIYYSPLQGHTAKVYLSEDVRKNMDSILYYKNETFYKKSSAVIESMSDANKLFYIMRILYVVPEFFRDLIYDFVAKNRYRLFGKSETCRIPSSEEKKYILE